MTEKIRNNHEQELPRYEKLGRHQERLHEHHEKAAEESEHSHKNNLESILAKIEREALSAQKIEHMKSESLDHRSNAIPYSKSLKKQSLEQQLKKARRELSSSEQAFSKFIHRPGVDMVSNTAAKTVARPSGLLGGGLGSFTISLGVLIVCRYFGYEYNFVLGLSGFVIGFGLGVVAELILKKTSS